LRGKHPLVVRLFRQRHGPCPRKKSARIGCVSVGGPGSCITATGSNWIVKLWMLESATPHQLYQASRFEGPVEGDGHCVAVAAERADARPAPTTTSTRKRNRNAQNCIRPGSNAGERIASHRSCDSHSLQMVWPHFTITRSTYVQRDAQGLTKPVQRSSERRTKAQALCEAKPVWVPDCSGRCCT
jgi:hypothetical protein